MKKNEMTVDTKGGWFRNRWRYLNDYYLDETIPMKDREEFRKFKDMVVYETPKTFRDGVAYNDGHWVIYHTCKKEHTNIYAGDRKELIRILCGYMTFLRVAGWNDRRKLLYSALVFFDRLVYREGMFDYNDSNIRTLEYLADTIMEKTETELTKNWTRGKTGKEHKGCWDDRKFAIDTKEKTRSEITKIQHKLMGKKEELDEKLNENYDHSLTPKQNLERLKEMGIKVGRSRLFEWLKDRKNRVRYEFLISENHNGQTDEAVFDYINSMVNGENWLSQEEMLDEILEMTKDFK